MIPEIAHFIFALGLTFSMLGSLILLKPSLPYLFLFARRCTLVSSILFVVTMLCLIASFVDQDLSVLIVSKYSHQTLPLFFKISASWGNHEGSMLLFIAIFGILASLVAFWPSFSVSFHAPIVLGLMSFLIFGFGLLVFILANPFLRLNPYPDEGIGFNPILQDPFLAFHPPAVYLGYAALSIAFCFALALLIRPKGIQKWCRLVRPVVQLGWSSLLLGIFLGAFWAYRELGWGGFWFWDPVENASLMPWLVSTALMHVLIIVDKRQLFVPWAVLLAILAFTFCLVAFFIVRSGLLVSVHAFTESPERGIGLLIFFSLSIMGAMALFAWRGRLLAKTIDFHPISRESFMIIGSMLLLISTMLVLLGTVYPLLSEAVYDRSVAIGGIWFNRAVAPLLLLVGVLAFITPMISWRYPQLRVSKGLFALTLCSAAVVAFVISLFFNNGTLTGFALWLGLSLSLSLVVLDLTRSSSWRRIGAWPGSLAHAGVAVLIPAVIASSYFSQATRLTIEFPENRINQQKLDDPQTFSAIEFIDPSQDGDGAIPNPSDVPSITLLTLEETQRANYLAQSLHLRLEQNQQTYTLTPERRRYIPGAIETVEVGRASHWLGDIQVTFDPLPFASLAETETPTSVRLRLIQKPLVMWVWIAGLIILVGGLVSLVRELKNNWRPNGIANQPNLTSKDA